MPHFVWERIWLLVKLTLLKQSDFHLKESLRNRFVCLFVSCLGNCVLHNYHHCNSYLETTAKSLPPHLKKNGLHDHLLFILLFSFFFSNLGRKWAVAGVEMRQSVRGDDCFALWPAENLEWILGKPAGTPPSLRKSHPQIQTSHSTNRGGV